MSRCGAFPCPESAVKRIWIFVAEQKGGFVYFNGGIAEVLPHEFLPSFVQ
jgi:hypothetical protein